MKNLAFAASIGKHKVVPFAANDGGTRRKIPGFSEEFEIDESGAIFRYGKIVKQWVRRGYPTISTCKNYKKKHYYVHALVALAFIGERPIGHDVDHIDFDRFNNNYKNLRYLPSKENAQRWKKRMAA